MIRLSDDNVVDGKATEIPFLHGNLNLRLKSRMTQISNTIYQG